MSAKLTTRVSKRPSRGGGRQHGNSRCSPGPDDRRERVCKACERCRMKKTKCDGKYPCKKCKDGSFLCTIGRRTRMTYKDVPKGYAEVLESTQVVLSETIQKLYDMVRSSQSWSLGEPGLSKSGRPIVHAIAKKLGCIKLNSYIDLPAHSVFPEDSAGLAELSYQLKDKHCDIKRGSKDSGSSNNQDIESEIDGDFDNSDAADGIIATISYPSIFANRYDVDSGPTNPSMELGSEYYSFTHSAPYSASLPMIEPDVRKFATKCPQKAEDGQYEENSMSQDMVDLEFGIIFPDNMPWPGLDVLTSVPIPAIWSAGVGEEMSAVTVSVECINS